MRMHKQEESDKIQGDKLRSAVDQAAAGGLGRKPGQTEPEEDEELDLEDREDTDTDETEDE